jgi:Fuc2NAc and GlcNAc transferase
LVCLPASMWGINLFNFMDGTDGLAASQSMALLIFVGITASQHAAHGLVLVCFGLLAIMTGFLVLNFPKASLFMGDSGSTVLGFMMVVFISSGSLSSPYMAAAALIGSANFIVDATLTLLRRWRAKASLMKPHRNHIYQRLARKLESHIRLLLAWHAWTLLTQVPLIIGMVFYDLSPYLAISICYGVTGIMWQCLNHRLAE